MIVLDRTTKQLELLLSASVASNPLTVVTNYELINSDKQDKVSFEGKISDSTPIVLVSLDDFNAGVTYVNIVNNDSQKALITVQIRNKDFESIQTPSDAITPLIKNWVLSPLDVCFYADNKWTITDKYGKMKCCCDDIHKPIRATVTVGTYTNADLIGLTAEFDFDVYSAEGSGVLLNNNDAYTFNSGTGTLTMPNQKYVIVFY